MTTVEEVLSILNEVKPTKDLRMINDIIDGGYIDSFELMALISSLNERFNIEISFDDIIPENFNSVNGIVDMVGRLIKHKG